MKNGKKAPIKRDMLIKALKNRVILLTVVGSLVILLAWTMPQVITAASWQNSQETIAFSDGVSRSGTELVDDDPGSSTQTNGVIIGGITLVLVVVGGTLGVIRRQD